MNPELIPDAVNANVLLLSLTHSMSMSRQRVFDSPALRSLANRLDGIFMVTMGQVFCVGCIPMAWRAERDLNRLVDRFRGIDIIRYSPEAQDDFCKLLEECCDHIDKAISIHEDLYLDKVLCLRWIHKRLVRLKESAEDLLEVWLLMRNEEFNGLLSSLLDEFGDHSKRQLKHLAKTT